MQWMSTKRFNFYINFTDLAQIAAEFMDFGLSLDNAELKSMARKVPEVLKSSVSENTFKSYTSGFKKWLEWSQKFKFNDFPVDKKKQKTTTTKKKTNKKTFDVLYF